jgi:ATP-dependent Zn protease
MNETPEIPPNPRGRRKGDRRLPVRPGRGQAMWMILGVLMMLVLAQAVFVSLRAGQTISYSEFKDSVRSGRVQEVTVSTETVHGLFKPEGNAKPKPFTAVRIEDPKLVEELNQYKVPHKGEFASRWVGEILGWIIPIICIVALWSFFFRRLGGAEGGVMSFARSRAKVYAEDDVKVRFADVAGVDEAEEELKEIVEFLETPKKYTSIGGRIPKGVLLVGPPGTGKTLLARAVAGPRSPSSVSAGRSSWRCSSASALRACAICSHRPMPRRRASYSSTSSMRSARSASRPRWAATRNASRR